MELALQEPWAGVIFHPYVILRFDSLLKSTAPLVYLTCCPCRKASSRVGGPAQSAAAPAAVATHPFPFGSSRAHDAARTPHAVFHAQGTRAPYGPHLDAASPPGI